MASSFRPSRYVLASACARGQGRDFGSASLEHRHRCEGGADPASGQPCAKISPILWQAAHHASVTRRAPARTTYKPARLGQQTCWLASRSCTSTDWRTPPSQGPIYEGYCDSQPCRDRNTSHCHAVCSPGYEQALVETCRAPVCSTAAAARPSTPAAAAPANHLSAQSNLSTAPLTPSLL
jgi:hypothetical protein